MRGRARPNAEIREVRLLARQGLSGYAVAARTGLPRSTVNRWRRGLTPRRFRRVDAGADLCPRCGDDAHAFEALEPSTYGYLLGLYLGDGSIARTKGRGHLLRIGMDCAYPGIIHSCSETIARVKGTERWPYVRKIPGKNLVTITSYWYAWPCFFPQHGPGRKHKRPIVLTDWQMALVEADPRPLIRGLIHSDGWRGLNRVRVKGKDYAYPRYQFSNRSADIKRIFTDACDLLGIEWRPWGRHHISVAKRGSVARMDEFVGPKT